jgi:hypothetical protein
MPHSICLILIFTAVRTPSKNKWCLCLFLVLDSHMFLVCHCTVTFYIYIYIYIYMQTLLISSDNVHEGLWKFYFWLGFLCYTARILQVEGRLSQVPIIVSFYSRSLGYPPWDTNYHFCRLRGLHDTLCNKYLPLFGKCTTQRLMPTWLLHLQIVFTLDIVGYHLMLLAELCKCSLLWDVIKPMCGRDTPDSRVQLQLTEKIEWAVISLDLQ